MRPNLRPGDFRNMYRGSPWSLIQWLPNLLTVSRLVAALVFPWVSADGWLPLVALAATSDLLDGWLSRKWQATTTFGRLLDPIADKAFVLSAGSTLCLAQLCTLRELLGIAARDLLVLFLAGLSCCLRSSSAHELRPRWLGKLATAGQLIWLLALVTWQRRWPSLTWLVMALSLAAALDYTVLAIRRVR